MWPARMLPNSRREWLSGRLRNEMISIGVTRMYMIPGIPDGAKILRNFTPFFMKP